MVYLLFGQLGWVGVDLHYFVTAYALVFLPLTLRSISLVQARFGYRPSCWVGWLRSMGRLFGLFRCVVGLFWVSFCGPG